MEILGVGFGRTGTASLKAALEQLGYTPCEHMFEVISDPSRVRVWKRVGEGGPVNWADVFGSYRASVDWPGAAYWRELVDEYPDAKVILTVRDADRWFDSAYKTIFRFPMRRHGRLQRGMFAMVSRVYPPAVEVPRMLNAVLWDRIFSGRAFEGVEGDREFAIKLFHEHNDAVKKYVPADRLLVFDVAQGWEPLCTFLGVPVPAEPFPRSNDADAFKQLVARRLRSAMIPVVAGFAAAGAAVAAGISAIVGAAAAVTGIAAVAGAVLVVAGFGGIVGLMEQTERRREQHIPGAQSRPASATSSQPVSQS